MTTEAELSVASFESRGAWEAWLNEHHSTTDGVWMRLAKKGSDAVTISLSTAVEVALCYGWIDGKARRIDADYWMVKFTPRRQKSKWSRINRERATKLIEKGKMKPAGLREVERAKADGRWDAAYDAPSSMPVPDDLQRALDGNDEAREFFASLDGRNRYAILYRIHDAKKPETRARRIAQYVAMLTKREKIYP